MKKVTALKNNDNVSIILGTKHYQFTGDKAHKVFDLAAKYKKNQTEQNLEELENEIAKINIVLHHGLVEEDGNGNFYLKGYRGVEMPPALAETIIEYAENDYPVEALVNFWKLCMANPNTQARDDFFGYVQRFGITITDHGYAVLYKSVAREEEADDELVNFVSQQYQKIKRWKKAPSKYAVVDAAEYRPEDGAVEGYDLVDCYGEDSKDPNDVQGSLGDLQYLHDNLDDLIEETDAHYVPHHSGGDYGNKIQLGKAVPMPREECDPDINNECSYGLHVGARQYVRTFGFGSKLVLAVLVNPMNIVALPKYDSSKIRTCEYYPYSVMAIDDEEWEEIEGGYFEEDYCDYEKDHIEEILSNLDSTEVETTEEETKERAERLINIYHPAQEYSEEEYPETDAVPEV